MRPGCILKSLLDATGICGINKGLKNILQPFPVSRIGWERILNTSRVNNFLIFPF
ncbi:hypothetical protein C1G86_1178 [Dehalococcoides mccartyi]|uniref:Uncharacterized protein n=1 Tax=Dehalococcoides mccartyi TaxID=61435 RepID=A0A328ERM5_9CHLR|nr:hypothetical protein C1G86_1178 [Dehalococcoides mccartyi]